MSRAETPEPRPLSAAAHRDAKKYKAAVDKVLSSFDAVESWPDNISFLTRLLRVLQAYPTIAEVPSKEAVSEAIALCLVPTLPNGVHQKALEVYTYIFGLIGAEGLAEDLDIWMPGLLPVLSFASVALKATLLTLFSTFIVPLGASLRPVARDLLLSILPGLEDEHDEAFSAVLDLMTELRQAVDDETLWWSSLWLSCILSQSSQRSGVLQYLLKEMPLHIEPSSACLGPDAGMLTRAFAAGLTDEDLLVQRGFLELLVARLTLSGSWTRQIPDIEMKRLFSAATQIVLRKDLSLNKRLWAWLMGPIDEAGQHDARYLDYGSRHLLAALKQDFELAPARTCRVLLSLIDKPDLVRTLLDDLFGDFLQALYRAKTQDALPDLLNSARALFDAMPLGIVFAHLRRLLNDNELDHLQFMLETFDFQDEEIVVHHLPILMLGLIHGGSQAELSLAKDISLWVTPSALLVNTTQKSPEEQRSTSFGDAWLDSCLIKLRQPANATSLHLLYELLLNLLDLGYPSLTHLIDFCQELAATPDLDVEHVGGIIHILATLQHTPTAQTTSALVGYLLQFVLVPANQTGSLALLTTLLSFISARQVEQWIAQQISKDLGDGLALQRFFVLYTLLPPDSARQLLAQSVLLVLDMLAFGRAGDKATLERAMKRCDSGLLLEVLLDQLESYAPVVSGTVRVLDNDLIFWQPGRDVHAYIYHLKLLAAFAQIENLEGDATIVREYAKAALTCRKMDDEQGVVIAQHSLSILAKTASQQDDLTQFLLDRLAISVHDGQFALQGVLLQAVDHYCSPNPAQLDALFLYGIRTARMHPIMADWLQFCTKQDMVSPVLVSSLCEMVDLSLLELSTGDPETRLSQVEMDNIVLVLETLRHLRQPDVEITSARASVDRPAGFLSSLLSTSTEEQPVLSPSSSETEVIRLTVQVSAKLKPADGTIQFATLRESAYQLLNSLFKENPAGVIQELLVQSTYQDEGEDLCVKLCTDAVDHLLSIICKLLHQQLDLEKAQFLQHLVADKSADVVGRASEDLIGLVRQVASRVPTGPALDRCLLSLVAEIASKLTALPKKSRKEVNELVLKILTQVSTKAAPEVVQLLLQLTPRLPAIFLDLDKVSGAVSAIMTHVIHPKLKSKTLSSDCLMLLEVISRLDGVQKSWRRDVQEYFTDASFFETGWQQGQQLSRIFRPWLLLDKARINDCLQKPNPSAPAHLFASQESERLFKVGQNRRLVFLMMALPQDALLAKLPLLLERVMELREKLLAESLLLLRALVLRFSAAHLRSAWPLFVGILKRAYNLLLDVVDESLLVQACETLDTVLALGLEDVQIYEWLFVCDTHEAVFGTAIRRSTLTERLAAKVGHSYTGPAIWHGEWTSAGAYLRNASISHFERVYGQEARDLDIGVWQRLFQVT